MDSWRLNTSSFSHEFSTNRFGAKAKIHVTVVLCEYMYLLMPKLVVQIIPLS